MRNFFTSIKLFLTSFLLILGATGWAENVEITFTPNNEMTVAGAYTVTKDGVSLSVTNGISNDSQFRIYKGETLTISSTSTITKVVFTCTASGTAKYGPGNFTDPSVGTYSFDETIGTWVGASNSVDFTAASNQVRATSIVVTLNDDGGETPSVAAPTITPKTGSYIEPQTVSISAADGLSVYYSTDGTNYQIYSAPFLISATTTVSAYAQDAEGTKSQTVTSTITILDAVNWSSIAEAKAASSAEGVFGQLSVSNALVTWANNYNAFITDGKDAILIYGNSGLKTGDKVSGTITGNNVIYSSGTGSVEISISNVSGASVNLTTISSNNEVNPVSTTIAPLKADARVLESMYVSISGVNFTSSIWDDDQNRRDTIYVGTDTILFYNQFKLNLSTLHIDVDKSYNVKGIVTVYRGVAQLAIISIDDVKMITNLTEPTSAWESEVVEIPYGQSQICSNAFSSNSDGAKTYTTSNDNVATVATDGSITIEGEGLVTITAYTAETSTYLASEKAFTLMVFHGDGTQEHPYNIDDVQYLYNRDGNSSDLVWVEGYVVGYADGQTLSSGSIFDAVTDENIVNTNVLLANVAGSTDLETILPIQLPNGDVRTGMQIAKVYGKKVLLQGDIQKYFGVAGIKSTADAIVNGVSVSIADIQNEKSSVHTIYDLAGQKVNTLTRGGLYIINGKKRLIK